MASITRFYALLLSTVLLLSGVPGFFPNISSFQPLITFFALTVVHSVVHAGVGVLGLLITALASDESVRIYTIGIALLYGVLALAGIMGLNVAPVLYFNTPDNWLHGSIFVLSLGVFGAGLAETRVRQREARILGGLPRLAGGATPLPGHRTGAPASQPRATMPAQLNAANAGPYDAPGAYNAYNAYDAYDATPWRSQPGEQPAPNVWMRTPTPQYSQYPHDPQYSPQQNPQQTPSQPYSPRSRPGSGPAGQPPVQPRDPWTREQRHAPAQPEPWQPGSQPSQWPTQWPDEQLSQQRPSQGPPPQSPWPQSHPSQVSRPSQRSQPHQPPRNPWAWEPQLPDEPPQAPQQQDQWPMDEWPSLNDSRQQQ